MRIHLSLAFAQLRHRPTRWVMLACGVLLTVMIPVVSAGYAQIVAAQTSRRALEALPVGDRTVTITGQRSVYASGHSEAEVNQLIASQIRRLTDRPTLHELAFRQISQLGSTFFLTAVDSLHDAVRLTNGRWPSSCSPTRCEVLAIGHSPVVDLTRAASPLGVVIVGQAERKDPTFLSGSFDTGDAAVLVGDGVDAMAHLKALELFDRTFGWVALIDVPRILRMGMASYLRLSADVNQQLDIGYVGIGYVRPDSTLASEDARAQLSARRFGLLSGTAASLMLGFAVVAAVSLRREHSALLRLARMRGSGRAPLVVMTAVMTGVVSCIGAVAGAAMGAVIVAVEATTHDLSSRVALSHVTHAAGPAILLTGAAVLVAATTLLWAEGAASSAWRALDVAIATVAATTVLVSSRGGTTAARLTERPDPLVVLLPVLASLLCGLLIARGWPMFARLLDLFLPGQSLSRRIGLLSAIRRPLRATVTAGFLSSALCLAAFVGGYRDTLAEGAADQAAARVPLDFTLTSGPLLVPPLTATSVHQVEALAPGVSATTVVRQPATVPAADGSAEALGAIGVDPAVLQAFYRWQRTTGSTRSGATLAQPLHAPTSPVRDSVPTGTRLISVESASHDPDVQVTFWWADGDGAETANVATWRDGALLTAAPTGVGGVRLAAVTVEEDPKRVAEKEHQIAEGHTAQHQLAGTLELGAMRADGVDLAWDWRGWTPLGSVATVTDGRVSVPYQLGGAPLVITPTPPQVVPIVVDADTARAAVNSTVALSVGSVSVAGHIVGVLPRFPTAGPHFAVLDRTTLSLLADRSTAGSGKPSEIWVRAPRRSVQAVARAFAHQPFSSLSVQSRRDVRARLSADPVASGSRSVLGLSAVLAVLVALLSIALYLVGERHDGAAELYAWEAEGVTPAALRRVMRVRAEAIIAFAVPGGVIAGLALARGASALVAVTASGTDANPPLQPSAGWVTAAGMAVGVVVVGVAVARIVVARFLREPLPERPAMDLR